MKISGAATNQPPRHWKNGFEELEASHSDRILPVDQPIAEQWGRFNVPDPLPVFDGLLAATASAHGLTLVTRNLKDVERTGVSCLNPFSG